MPISIVLDVVSCASWQKSRKIPKKRVTRVQGHSRSSNLSPIERACATSYQWLIVTSAVSRMVSYSYGDLLAKTSPLGHTTVSFNALARGDPLRICGLPDTENRIILRLLVLTKYRRVKDREKCCRCMLSIAARCKTANTRCRQVSGRHLHIRQLGSI